MTIRYPTNVWRAKLLDEYAAEAVAAGSYYGASVEVPRGAEDLRFYVEGTLFDRTQGDETYTFAIQGRNSSSESFVDIPSLVFTTISATTGAEVLPTAATAEGISVPRFIRVRLTTVGSTPIATAKIWMWYTLNTGGPGRQYQANYYGG